MSDPTGGAPRETTPSSGWTNEYIRDGYDVDGADSRVTSIPKEWQLRIIKLLYELFGATLYRTVFRPFDRRIFYPTLRLFGSLFRRERQVEQYVAENEYAAATVIAAGRAGVGSPYWVIALAGLVGLFLVGYGIGWVVIMIGRGVVDPASPGLLAGVGGLTTVVTAYVALKQMPNPAEDG